MLLSELINDIRLELDDTQANIYSDYELKKEVNRCIRLLNTSLINSNSSIVTKKMCLRMSDGIAKLPSDFNKIVSVLNESSVNENVPGKIMNAGYVTNGDTSIIVSWDLKPDTDNYRVYDEDYVLLAETMNIYSAITVVAGETYGLYIIGVNENGEGLPSDLLTVDLTSTHFRYDEDFSGTLTNCSVVSGVLKPTLETIPVLTNSESVSLTSDSSTNYLQVIGEELYSLSNNGLIYKLNPITKAVLTSVDLSVDRVKMVLIGNTFYCFGYGSSIISKINKTSFSAVGTIDVSAEITGEITDLATDGTSLYVFGFGGTAIKILKVNPLNGAILEVTKEFATTAVSNRKALQYDSGKLYCAYQKLLNDGELVIVKIDVITKDTENTLAITETAFDLGSPYQMLILGDYMYLSSNNDSVGSSKTIFKIKTLDLTVTTSMNAGKSSNGAFYSSLATDGTSLFMLQGNGILSTVYTLDKDTLNENKKCENFISDSSALIGNIVFLDSVVCVSESNKTNSAKDVIHDFVINDYLYSISGEYKSGLIDLTTASTAISTIFNFTKTENGISTVKVYIRFTSDNGVIYTSYYECTDAGVIPYIEGLVTDGVKAMIKIEFTGDIDDYAQIEDVSFDINL